MEQRSGDLIRWLDKMKLNENELLKEKKRNYTKFRRSEHEQQKLSTVFWLPMYVEPLILQSSMNGNDEQPNLS